jgi:hypothetical protein
MDDWILIQVEIVNRGRTPVFFFKELGWGHPGTLDYVVFDKDGKPVEPMMVIEDGLATFLTDDNEKLIKLDAGESFKKTRKFPVSGLVKAPGQYVLRVRYEARTEMSSFMGLAVWNREAGPLSGSFRFEVIDR